jgi:hypothetical protein
MAYAQNAREARSAVCDAANALLAKIRAATGARLGCAAEKAGPMVPKSCSLRR